MNMLGRGQSYARRVLFPVSKAVIRLQQQQQ